MKNALLILPFLAASAWGQAEDVYKTLSLGDRVQITFRSGGTITGQLEVSRVGRMPKPKGAPEDALDYTKETSLTINLSWEYPGLDGSMTVLKKEIKEVRKLQKLDQETMDRLREQKERIRKELEGQNLQNEAEAKKREQEALAEAKKLAEKAKAEGDAAAAAAEEAKQAKLAEEGMKILKKFPPEAGWGPQRLDEIAAKSQIKNSVITPDEREFMQNFQQWLRAKEAQDKPKGETPNK